ncbi:unnamed protein product [Paramecium sonneborni]|uniref:Uncharacterized protein n=1 Tax=Paramecium sonneborni TaxID=65129 RepID=A0A8S1NKW3_9CILI|nr:unnamed protein product [Paramecium sonneborni]
MQNHQLYLILDINSKFIKPLKENFVAILQCIKTSLGLQLCTDFHNYFTIYAIDTYDIYQLYRNGQNSGFEYNEEFQQVLQTLYSIISKKGVDDIWESKIIKCLCQIMCRINKDKEKCLDPKIKEKFKDSKITFITSQYFQLSQESYNKYLKLCTHASKEKIRLDLLQIDIQAQSELKPDVLGNEGLKLGVQLTSGIVHRVEQDRNFNKILAELLLSSFNPGDCQGFFQAKLSELQYKSFCSCCNKVTNPIAYACSSCLTVQCEKSQTNKQCKKCKNYFHNVS